jgi:DNA-binding protein H-NS
MGVQETKIRGEGSLVCDIEGKGAKLYYSGCADVGKLRNGVGILVKKSLLKDIKQGGVHFVNDRMMWLEGCFYGKEMAVVSVYAPTMSYSREEKLLFYQQLDELIASIPRIYEMKLILGDWNARVGVYREEWDHVRGRFIGGECNENGTLLLQFCSRNELVLSNTFFEKKRYTTHIHAPTKQEWTLDYCLIPLSCKKLLVDSGVNFKADCFTDHFMVYLTLDFNSIIKKKAYKAAVRKTDYGALSSDVDLRVAVGRRVDELLVARKESGKTVDWEAIMHISRTVCEQLIPKVPKKSLFKGDWFDPNDALLCDYMKRRRILRALYLECKSNVINKIHKRFQKMIVKREKEMRNAFWLQVAKDIQEFDDKNDARSLFAATKLIYGNKKIKMKRGDGSGGVGLYRKDGSFATTEEEINLTWLEHCQMLFNQPSEVGDITGYLGVPKGVNESLARPFVSEELLVALKLMRFKKAPGNDTMPVEVFCLMESEHVLEEILKCYNYALETGNVDKGMRDVIITTLFKKGSPLYCDNYRTLSLINHMGKVLEKMIQIRLTRYCEENRCLPESQNGFRNDRSTVDAMFISRLLASSAREKMINIYKVFVDLTKAYDKVNRSVLWVVLGNIGVPEKMIRLIRGTLDGSKASIRIKGKCEHSFDLNTGLKQGSVFSPLLFNIFFGAIIDAWQRKCVDKGIPLMFNLKGDFMTLGNVRELAYNSHVSITDLLFADDAEFVATSPEDLQFMMKEFEEITLAFGQQVSVKKTKVMVVHKRLLPGEHYVEDIPLNIVVDGQSLENVDVFTYVGGKENIRGDMDDEVAVRLSRMSAAFASLSDRVFMNPHIHLLTKLRIFDSVVISNGLYGCAIWNIKDKQIHQLDSWKFRHLKKILRCKWSDYCSYVDVIERIRKYGIKIGTIEMTITRRRLLYLGHVMRMDDSRLPKKMLYGGINLGRRVTGGQETSYHKCLRDDLIKCKMPTVFEDLEKLALDKGDWLKKVEWGVGQIYNDWNAAKNDESYYRHFEELLSLEQFQIQYPNQEVAYNSWMEKKHGEFWRIELEESNITVRGKRSLRFLEVRQKKKYKVDLPEESKVTRVLREFRKNNQ